MQKDIDTISSAIISFLLLVVICVSCYFYYAKYRWRQPFHNNNIKLGKIRYWKCIIKMESNYKLNRID